MSELFTPRGLWQAMTSGDRVVSAAVLVLSAALTLGLRGDGVPAQADVLLDGKGVATLSLRRDGTYTFDGRVGPVTVRVADGAVRVVESSCAQHICIAMGAKRRAGEIIACVPNALVIRLRGSSGGDAETPDSIAR